MRTGGTILSSQRRAVRCTGRWAGLLPQPCSMLSSSPAHQPLLQPLCRGPGGQPALAQSAPCAHTAALCTGLKKLSCIVHVCRRAWGTTGTGRSRRSARRRATARYCWVLSGTAHSARVGSGGGACLALRSTVCGVGRRGAANAALQRPPRATCVLHSALTAAPSLTCGRPLAPADGRLHAAAALGAGG